MSYNPDLCAAQGIHDALATHEGVHTVLGNPPRLYDNAPEDPVYPYLTYGAARSEDIGGDDAVLTAHVLTLHIWSRYGGRTESLTLINEVRAAIEQEGLSFDGCHLISASVIYSDVFRNSDGRTLHGILRVSLRLEPEIESEMETA